MSEYETIRYERDEFVGKLTLARPQKHNAQNPLMWRELVQLGEELLLDQTLRCLVVTGEGPSFSSGIDLVEGMPRIASRFAERSRDENAVDLVLTVAGAFAWIPRLGCPSVAAVRGHAYGAGLQLALCCDFRVFSRTATVGLMETRYGLLPDMGATVRLPRIVGESKARELILLAEIIDAAEAHRIGLANRVVEDRDLESSVADLARRLSGQPPLAIQGARRAIDAAWHLDSDQSFKIAAREQVRCLASEDFKEGLNALAEGRAPRWRGE